MALPHTIDGELRAADLALGLDGFALSRFSLAHLWARWTVEAVYGALPLVVVLAWIVGRSHTLLRAALIGALAALPVYMLLPAVGPEYVFQGWPDAAAHFVPGMAGFSPRNCMPSMHTAWAALAALNVRGRWRAPFAVYAGLMALATVAGGEHYFVDVLAALPWTLALQVVSLRIGRSVNAGGS
jgi:PAP2 superfamily